MYSNTSKTASNPSNYISLYGKFKEYGVGSLSDYSHSVYSRSKFSKVSSNSFTSPDLVYNYTHSKKFPKLTNFKQKKTKIGTPLLGYGYFDVKNYNNLFNTFQEPKYFNFFDKKNKYKVRKKIGKGSKYFTNFDYSPTGLVKYVDGVVTGSLSVKPSVLIKK